MNDAKDAMKKQKENSFSFTRIKLIIYISVLVVSILIGKLVVNTVAIDNILVNVLLLVAVPLFLTVIIAGAIINITISFIKKKYYR